MEIEDGFCIVEDDMDDLPYPEPDENLLDLSYIHKAVWNTYWVDLCGATFRLYKDSSIPANSALYPPPVSQYGALSEDTSKFAFFELDGAKITVLEDGSTFGKKWTKKPKVYRRHMFQVNFQKIKSYYVFQASSHSSLLRWLSKIQESIDAIADDTHAAVLKSATAFKNNENGHVVEERLKLARFMMEKSHLESIKNNENDMADDVSETVSIFSEISRTTTTDDYGQLKKKLKEKKLLVWQIEQQTIDFLGNKGVLNWMTSDFKREEFTCPIKQDYYLVPGRMETFIPAGTNVTIFGQLPNRRWRCLVEMDALITSMNNLVKDLQPRNTQLASSNSPSNSSISSLHKSSIQSSLLSMGSQASLSSGLSHSVSSSSLSKLPSESSLQITQNNLPDYPLIGCLPESVLDYDLTDFYRIPGEETSEEPEEEEEDEGEIGSPIFSEEEVIEEVDEEPELAIPYSSHKRKKSRGSSFNNLPLIRINSQPGNDIQEEEHEKKQESTNTVHFDLTVNQQNLDSSADAVDLDEISIEVCDDDDDDKVLNEDTEDNDDEQDDSNEKPFLRNEGFLLRKKLRQKGLSIIVGSSSSSEDESEVENDVIGGGKNPHRASISNAVYRKFVAQNTPDKNDNYTNWKDEDGSYIRSKNEHPDLKQSYSCTNINSTKDFTADKELLQKFGQKSIHLEQDKELAKRLLKVFEERKGPDVKPPRNERRTLKLSKTDEEGFGFWLQTYGFGRQKDHKRTFVRYVEDEGPAYMAGLREGDVIVEVNGQNVEEIEHMKIVELITEAKKQLILVVKFMDAVRRVELAVRLKKKETKLKAKMEELQKLKDEEEAFLNGGPLPSFAVDVNKNTDSDTDTVSLNASIDSEHSSMSSLSSEDVIVRTSKFEKRSSRVLDSIKELHCIDLKPNSTTSNIDPSMTTENDLLNVYSDHIEGCNTLGRRRTGTSVKRTESMPVQKYTTLPRYKAVIDLDGNYAREYSIENSATGHISNNDTYSIKSNYSKETSSGDEADDDSDGDEEDGSVSPDVGLSRKNRQSYKLAMKVKLKDLNSDLF